MISRLTAVCLRAGGSARVERRIMSNKDATEGTFPKAETCPGKIEIPTEKEKQALAALKSIKERVRAIKKRLGKLEGSGSDSHGAERSNLEEELKALKTDWDAWEERRKKAAKERMILLGHEEAE
jgi:ABC-type phosphate transport system auxiliary subunit